MMCPRCGADLPAGGACPACGWVDEGIGRREMGPAGEPALLEAGACGGGVDAPPGVPVPYPDTGRASDHASDSPVRTDGDPISASAREATPSEGDEPGTGGSGPSRSAGGANPLLVACIVVVIAVVLVATLILLSKDGNDGDDNPGDDLVIDQEGSTVEPTWEPTPGFHLSVVVLNDGDATTSLDGHDLLVTVLHGPEEVGRTTMVLSGDLAGGRGRGVLVNVGVALASGGTYQVVIMLREDGTVVDGFSTDVTVPPA